MVSTESYTGSVQDLIYAVRALSGMLDRLASGAGEELEGAAFLAGDISDQLRDLADRAELREVFEAPD